MGRPKTINAHVAAIAVEAARRIMVKQANDPTYMLTERDAKVLKTLAEAQVVLQKRRPEEGGEGPDDGTGMTIDELERATEADPEKPTAESTDNDAG